jgi:hypothetical protein
MMIGKCHVLTDIWPSMVQSRSDIDEKSSASAAPCSQARAQTAPPLTQLSIDIYPGPSHNHSYRASSFVVAARLPRVAECLEAFELPSPVNPLTDRWEEDVSACGHQPATNQQQPQDHACIDHLVARLCGKLSKRSNPCLLQFRRDGGVVEKVHDVSAHNRVSCMMSRELVMVTSSA